MEHKYVLTFSEEKAFIPQIFDLLERKVGAGWEANRILNIICGRIFYGEVSHDAARLSSCAFCSMISASLGMLKAPEIRS